MRTYMSYFGPTDTHDTRGTALFIVHLHIPALIVGNVHEIKVALGITLALEHQGCY